jgi:PPM family protein phosphatase
MLNADPPQHTPRAPQTADSAIDTSRLSGNATGPAPPRCVSPRPASGVSSPRLPSAGRAKSLCTRALPSARAIRFGLEFDDGTLVALGGRGLIGRAPTAGADAGIEHLIPLADRTLSVSRTHLEFCVGEAGLWIRDCASTNGSQIEIGGDRYSVAADELVAAPPGCTVHLGVRRVRVRTIGGRAAVGPATVEWGAATRTGAARRHNEDAYCAEAPVFVVADGMGGHAAGELASREVVDALLSLTGDLQVTGEMFATCLADARARLAGIPVLDGGAPPGATLSGVIVTQSDDDEPQWMVINLGDSRTYRMGAQGFRQLTVDHSVAQELVDAGLVAASDARTHPLGSVLTRAVLAETDHLPDVWLLPMTPGERILVCSDGVTRQLDDAFIAGVLGALPDPLAAAQELVNPAAGFRDDATALVIDAVGTGSP